MKIWCNNHDISSYIHMANVNHKPKTKPEMMKLMIAQYQHMNYYEVLQQQCVQPYDLDKNSTIEQ